MRVFIAKRVWPVVLVLAFGLRCGGGDPNDPGSGPEVAAITIGLAADSLLDGATRQIQYALEDAGGNVLPSRPLNWSSSNPNVASIDGNAILTAHSPGATVITGSLAGLSDQISMKVLIAVATVTLSPDTVSLLPGEQQLYQAVTRDQIGNLVTGRTITWGSIPTGRVTIAGTTVTAQSPGSVQIQATTVLQPVQGTATVTVLDTVATITVTSTTDSLLASDTTRATAVSRKASGALLPPQPVVWSSSNTAIATVSSSGLITAIGPGQATILATLRNKVGSTAVRVLMPTGSVTVRPNPIIMAAPGTMALFATIRDTVGGNLPGRSITWSQSGTAGLVLTPLNSSVASITGGGTGISQVTATTDLEGVAGSSQVEVGRSITFDKITSGLSQVCGTSTDQLTWCWGAGAFDQVTTDVPTTAEGWPAFASVVAGSSFRCGLTAAGLALCWGDSEFGKLGNGTGTPAAAPVQVSGGLSWTQLSAGPDQACGISTDGNTYCWGRNFRGQLGNNSTAVSFAPVQVLTPVGVSLVSISTGADHTCGLTAVGKAYCWGWNDAGKLGIDTIETVNSEAGSRLTPVPVNTGLFFSSISAGGSHTCGIALDGSAWCWGYGGTGALGNNASTNSLHAVPVAGGLTFQQISASREFTCGIVTGGEAYCWGRNTENQLGPNGGLGTLVPVTVGINVTQLATGFRHACAMVAGVVYCWGNTTVALGLGTAGNPNGSVVPVKVAGQP